MKLLVVAVSTRPARQGFPVVEWAFDAAKRHGAFEVTLVDLAAVALPLFDEPEHPRFGRYQHEHTKRWSAIVAPADAFVFVAPEYNYSPSPSLTNALDYLSAEWAYKPAAFVSYGAATGGARGVQMAKLTMTGLRMMPLPEGVMLPFFSKQIEGGVFRANEGNDKAAAAMLGELERWARALKTLRG
jgi:NAD(P)H-dependent FMN reductase